MKAKRFAEGTEVTASKTRDELDQLLAKHGATQRAVIVDDEARRARVQFSMQGRMVRLDMRIGRDDLPDPSRSSYRQDACPRGWDRMSPGQRKEWIARQQEQYEREAWRRLLLVCKAKLEIVADGSRTLEEEFLANILLPDGSTVHERLAEQLAVSYESGAMPRLLGDGR